MVVGEGRVGTDDYVASSSTPVHSCTPLDRHPVADGDADLDEDAVADVAVGPDPCAGST